jgi:hypothetical protein
MNFNEKNNKKLECRNLDTYMKIIKIIAGHGGSDNLVFIGNKNNKKIIIKIIPTYFNNNLKQQRTNDQNDISIYKLFKKNFILKNITQHIVGIYEHKKCVDIKKILPFNCPTIDQMLKYKYNKYIENFCLLLMDNNIQQNTDLILMEYCEFELNKYLINVVENNKKNILMVLDRIIFQVIFTLAMIRRKYPTFRHNDLFIRNILGHELKHYPENEYIEYKYKNKRFYLPVNGFFVKINDFGESTIHPFIKYSEKDNIKFGKSDLFDFLYDLYNGQNLGSSSLSILLGKNKHSLLKKYFDKFLNIEILDKIIINNKELLDSLWNIENSAIITDIIDDVEDYLSNDIFENYYKLPKQGLIIKSYGY